jgi:hypothetical protein
MKTNTILATILLVSGLAVWTSAGNGPPVPDAIWADGVLYATVITPANLPPHGPKDGLFVIPDLAGQRPVSESKPGDRDYNGGRWQVYLVDVINANNIPGELTSWEEVQNYISSGDLAMGGMGPSFVCPLIPR